MADAAPAAGANTAVAKAVMQPEPGAAVPIAQAQRRKLSDLTRMVHSGEMPDVDLGAAANQQQQVAEQDGPAFFGDEVPEQDPLQQLQDRAFESNANQIEVDDSQQAELVSPEDYQALKAKFDADDLAVELQDKWVEATVDGKPWRITVKEAVEGYQREADYSMKLGQVAEERRQVQTARAGLERLLGDMDDSEGFQNAMRVLGKWGTEPEFGPGGIVIKPGTGFLGAAYAVGEKIAEEWEMRKTNPAAYAERMRQRQSEQRIWQAEQRALQAEQRAKQLEQGQQAQPDQEQQRIGHQLQQMMPIALKTAGIEQLKQTDQVFALEWDANAEKLFELHWQNLLPTLQGPLTTAFVTMVVNATKQTCQQRAASLGRPVPSPKLPPAAAGRAGAPQAGQPGSNGAPKRAKIQDMGKLLGRY